MHAPTPTLLLFTLSLLFSATTQTTHPSDIAALHQLKSGLDPSSLTPGSCISSWDFSLDPCDSLSGDSFTCGFSCDDVVLGLRRVTEVALDQAGYSGFINCTSWNLPFLSALDLSGNNFAGSIPDSLTTLTHLRRLSLSHNAISGDIPATLGNLPALEELYLDNNHLSGQIPATLNNLTNLKRLELQSNNLTGDFPDLTRLANLTFLDASDNAISSELPASFPAGLVEISLRNNYISGEIPESITKLGFLQVLDLTHNQLSGSIPAGFFTHPNLQQLELGINNLTSIQVPSNLGTQSGLIAIDLGTNRLTGSLPYFMGMMPKLSALNLEKNEFRGMIPVQYAFKTVMPEPGMAGFERLLLGWNYLYGPIPDPFKGLKEGSVNVDLGGNCLFLCPETLFFCQGDRQRSLMECRSFGPVTPLQN